MKKIYKNPEMEIIKIATMQMLANSINADEIPTPPDEAEGRGDGFDW